MTSTTTRTTSWPWLKGLSEPIADPIEPICPEDVRPSVKALIQEHRAHIDAVREGIADDPLFEASKHDDLWILRFVLSHKQKVKPAIAAAKVTLLFRKEHGLDAADIRELVPHKVQEGRVKEYWDKRCPGDSLILTLPDPQRGIVSFIRVGETVPGASDLMTFDTWEYAFIYGSEWAFQWLDYITRTTGRLTRCIRIIDLKGITMRSVTRKDMKFDGQVSEKMEDCYPQLLESIKVCHAPTFVHLLWAVVRKIMPKRVVEKFDVIEPKTNKKELEALYKHISANNLPVEYGGSNTVAPHDW